MSDFPPVTIIGAGPVGLFAAFACGMLGLRCNIVDILPQVGGQCTALYPDKPIYDIPGYPAVSAGDLIENLTAQAKPFAPRIITGQQIKSLKGTVETGFTLETDGGLTLDAKAIVIAGGNGSFAPQRPPLNHLELYEGASVFYTVMDRNAFAGKRVVIAGGGDTAVDWALLLHSLGCKVILVHRRDKFRAAPASVEKLQDLAAKGEIAMRVPWQLHGLEGNPPQITHVLLESADGGLDRIEADILLPCFGIVAALGPLADWGLHLDRHQIAIDQGTSQTSIPGVYAVGDIAAYPHKLKLIATGFAESIQAAHAIYRQLHPEQPLHFVHSTDKGVPGKAA